MVTLRDGKRYDVGAAASASSDDYPELVRPRRRASTGISSAQQRRSRRSAVAELYLAYESEPPSPAATPRRSKRGRAEPLMVTQQLQDDDDDSGMDTGKDQDITPGKSELNTVQRPDSPSPLPKKKARVEQPKRQRKGSSSWLWPILVVAAVAAAVGAAVLRPEQGEIVNQAVQQAFQQASAALSEVQLSEKLAAVKQSAAAAAAAASHMLKQHASMTQHHLHNVLMQLHVNYPRLVPDSWTFTTLGRGGAAPQEGAWSAEVLAGVFPDGQQWQELASDISEKLQMPAAQRGLKAIAMILACASKDDCAEAAAALSLLPPRADICSLTIQSAELVEASSSQQPAAALQAMLAPFLRRCPKGLVLLLHAESLPVAALLALHNGLSELGGFQHDGSVSSGQAAYAFLLQLPIGQVAEMAAVADTTAVDSRIKDAFFQIKQQQLAEYQQQSASTNDAAQSEAVSALGRVLRSLHRRIDFAAPVRLGPVAENQLEQENLQEAAAAGHLHYDVDEE